MEERNRLTLLFLKYSDTIFSILELAKTNKRMSFICADAELPALARKTKSELPTLKKYDLTLLVFLSRMILS